MIPSPDFMANRVSYRISIKVEKSKLHLPGDIFVSVETVFIERERKNQWLLSTIEVIEKHLKFIALRDK
jgi:hypothetical protein